MDKKKSWNKLLQLMNEDPDWSKKPRTKRYKQITKLGQKIYKSNELKKIDKCRFDTLVKNGYTLNQIAIEFKVSQYTLRTWRKNNGYIKKRKLEEIK